MRAGIEVIQTPGTVSSTTTSVTVTVRFWVTSVSWGFQDNQVLSDSFGDSHSYYFNVPSGSTTQWLIAEHSFSVATSFSGGPTYTFRVDVTGLYTGGTPSHAVTYTVPTRPSAVPSAPAPPSVSSITATSAYVSWNAPNNNGSPIRKYELQVSKYSNFSTLAWWAETTGARTVSPLDIATQYYARVRAYNDYGWGPWSGTTGFRTLATVPGAPATVNISDIRPDAAALSWSEPLSNGSPITRYRVHVSLTSNFAELTHNLFADSRAQNLLLLSPATKYYVRVQAENGVGWGPWSTTMLFETLSGGEFKHNNIWKSFKAWTKVNGEWVITKVWKKNNNGNWVI